MEEVQGNTVTETFDWNKEKYTGQEIMDAPIESKIEKLIKLTSPAAVNTAFEKFIEDWLIDELEESGVVIVENYEVD